VRVENVEYVAQYIPALLNRCEKRHVERTYDIRDWDTPDQFLDLLARKTGKLLKGGEADVDTVAKTVVNDFLRGRIPWFVAPPRKEGEVESEEKGEEGIEGRKGRLGEMGALIGTKRKRDGNGDGKVDSAVETVDAEDNEDIGEEDNDEDEGSVSDSEDGNDEFAGFDEDGDEAAGVVLPAAFGNLDEFAEDDDDENDDEVESESLVDGGDDEAEAEVSTVNAAVDDDTHDKKRRKKA
jgi:nuclear GTP-binding protein